MSVQNYVVERALLLAAHSRATITRQARNQRANVNADESSHPRTRPYRQALLEFVVLSRQPRNLLFEVAHSALSKTKFVVFIFGFI